MSKVTIALGSFVVGVCFALVISTGIHASVWAKTSSLSPPRTSAEGLIAPEFIPPLPGIMGLSISDLTFGTSRMQQQLDGLNCDRCTFNTSALTYGGGAYRLTGSTFKGVVRIKLTGAAANTLGLLEQLGLVKRPKTGALPMPFNPPRKFETAQTVTIETDATKPINVTLVSAIGAEPGWAR